ncbi:MAG: HDOD domain-containing protein [Gammaproteobacteria bacterium]|nr:HDOD domain-containing protein [Gammaproteobacteria bacterium]MBL7000252.1 HDOD domain-containing protein [Gammaproteobacteria bacterium]
MSIVSGHFTQRQRLKPLNALDKNDLEYLYSQSEMQQLNPRSLLTAEQEKLVYLLEGEVSLLSGGFVTEKFNHLDQRALSPLFNESLDQDSALFTRHGTIILVNRSLFEGLYSQAQAVSLKSIEAGLTRSENELFDSLLNAFIQKKMDLPVLPEAALKVRQAISSPEVGSDEIIQIVQSDPVLSARLVRVANSSLYGTWREIKTVRDAVRRLGIETTKNLSFSLSVKQLFTANTSLIKKTIQKVYNESTSVGAIAYVITLTQARHLDPEQALLSGLIQNLGVIPILKYIDAHPSMMQSAHMLGKSIEHLQLPVSNLMFNEWNFDPEFIEIVKNVNNWQRDSGEQADYCDIVIAARLLYLDSIGELPVEQLSEVPVIRKLRLTEHDADGHYFMDRAEQKIAEMNKLLQTV